MTNGSAYFSTMSTKEKVDAGTGIIYGVSVITMGEAAGKNAGTYIDKTTLSQLLAVASKFPDGVKVKLSQAKEHDGSVGQIVGTLRNFRVDGQQLRANLHLLKSDSNFSRIVEMAETMPSEFGLSIVIPKELEKVDGKDYLRCSEIYSIDLVESPAANPSGLFSSKLNDDTAMSKIKYASGDSGAHAKDCECKECMSKHSKKEMSALVAGFLGLPDTATEAEIAAAFKASAKTADVAALTAKIEKLEAGNANALAFAKKVEIENLMAEASKAGKAVPFENSELFTEKDGAVTIHMEPTQLAKVISRLQPSISLSRGPKLEAPKNADGKTFDRRTKEGREQLTQWCLSKQRENGAALSAEFASLGLTKNN